MIRHYEGFRLPRGLKSQLLRAHAVREEQGAVDTAYWRQTLLSDLVDRKQVVPMLSQIVGQINQATGEHFDPLDFSCVLHWGRSEQICGHRDEMARTSFLIPLRCAPTIEFFVEHKRCVLHGKRLVRFSDHDYHGLLNPNVGQFFILSVSRDQMPWRGRRH